MIPLYQPEKYKVHVGEGASIGFCTAWNEPDLVFKRSDVLRKKTRILGTLYSRQGVNVILRNLALNPEIKKLVLWANGPLSNTQFGKVGWSLLKKIWEDGIESDGTVKGTHFKIEKEIDVAVIEKVRSVVELVDESNRDFDDVEEGVGALKDDSSRYMEPVEFPEAVPEKVETFPSEEVGWLMHGRGIIDTWMRLVDRIMRYGTVKGTQYGYQQRELIGATWVVREEDPIHPDLSLALDWPKELREVTGATEEALKEYHAVFLSKEKPANLSYTYGNRLMAYPNGSDAIDQIRDVIVAQFKKSPDTRRGVATTMVPAIDKDSTEPPCITQVQGLQTKGKFHLLVTVRSHDIFKAAIPNAFGLRMMQKTMADELGFGLGQIQITSQSAHIYEQDWENAFKLVRCRFWEREPSLVFDPNTQADPRGVVVISISGNRILSVLQDMEGRELARIEGVSAAEVGLKIAHLELLSRPDHYFDIGLQLARAEMALMKKLPFHQDKPLIF
jgi:thymidylate synthase